MPEYPTTHSRSARALPQILAGTTALLYDLTLSITRWRMHGQCNTSFQCVSNTWGNIPNRKYPCRAASKPYTSSEATAFNPAAWQRDSRASTATQDPWAFAPRQTTFGYGSDSLNTWQQQQQYANAQQTAATEQHAQPQQQVTIAERRLHNALQQKCNGKSSLLKIQGWPPGSENLGHTEQHQLMHQLQHQQPQQQVQLQQQQQNPQIVRKPNSGDQLVQVSQVSASASLCLPPWLHLIAG